MRIKRTAVAVVLFAIFFAFCFGVSVSAAENYYDANLAEITEKSDLLTELMNEYASPSINGEITPYVSKIVALRGDGRINTEDLSDEIYMYYLKGCVAGKCAWVYVTYSSSLGEAELVAVADEYVNTIYAINGNGDIADLEAKQTAYPLGLMKEIYVQRIEMLYDTSTDSQDIAILAYSYELEIKDIAVLDSAEFDKVYNQAKDAIEAQRRREQARESFILLYDSVYGEGAYELNKSGDKNIISFLHTIGQSASVSQLNADLKNSADNVLAAKFNGMSGEYSQALLSKLSSSVADVVSAADALGEIADDWSLFVGLDMMMSIAQAKDGLVEYMAPDKELAGMSALVAEYNADGGIFDGCANADEVALESDKAKLRVDWLVYVSRAKAETQGIYGDNDASVELGKLDEIHSSYDSEIKGKATLDTAQDAFTEAKAKADERVSIVRSRLEEFREQAYRAIDGSLEDCLFNMKHNIKYLESADAVIATMREKHSAGKEEIGAAQSLSELESIMSAVRNELEALYSEAESENLEAAKKVNADKIRDKEATAKKTVTDKKYLDDATRYTVPLAERADSAVSEIADATDVAQMEKTAEDYAAYADGIVSSANAENAENERVHNAKVSATADLAADRDSALGKLEELGYLSDAEIADVKQKIASVYDEYLAAIEQEDGVDGVSSALTDGKSKLDSTVADAAALNVENARTQIKKELKDKLDSFVAEEYSEENYGIITKAYGDAVAAIDAANDVSSFISERDRALKRMNTVISRFEAAKNAAKSLLAEEYNKLCENSDRYSEENLENLSEIYQHTLSELESLDKGAGEEFPGKLVDQRIALMRDIRVDWVSSGNLSADSSASADYPAGHDPEKDKLWGVVSGSEGLYYDISLSITLKDIQKEHESALDSAVESGSIAYVGDDPLSFSDIAMILEDSDIKAVYDIKLIRDGEILSSFNGKYTVRILLPENMRDIEGLKAVYIGADGKAEYYDAKRDGAFLVFETEHFSEFVIVGEKIVDLLPLIVILGVLALVEVIFAVALTLILSKERRASLYAVAMPVSTLSLIAPRGGIAWVIILAVIDVALGVYIAVCVAKLIASHRPEKSETVEEIPEEPIAEPVGEDFADETEVVLPIEPMDSVSAEEADSLVPDSSVEEIIVREESPEIFRGKKAFVNVDTISDNFEVGDIVTLKELKEKKLVPQNVCYLKVLARGIINKPLTVKAQSFSANAVKMIALTGGTAVVESNGEYVGS